MRVLLTSFMTSLCVLSFGTYASAQVSAQNTFTTNLSLGSSGAQVILLQQILNRDLATRIASTGPGSPGNETSYFGLLTKATVIRFQNKYASAILVPAGLTQGNGYVGFYTRAKLNAFSSTPLVAAVTPPAPTIPAAPATTVNDYLAKESEKIDIYAGDTLIMKTQDRIVAAINAAIAAGASSTQAPSINVGDFPSVVIKTLIPEFGGSGARVSLSGNGITSASHVYFGSGYIIRAVSPDLSGGFSFTVPPIPAGRYDLAVETNGAVSATRNFVVTDPKNPLVHIQSVTPAMISFNGTLTITGSDFSPGHNVVVTIYQKFTDVSSPDGRTLSVQFAPESLRVRAQFGNGSEKIPVYVSVVNDYGFSDTVKSFILSL